MKRRGPKVTSESAEARRKRHKRANHKLEAERMKVKYFAMLINSMLVPK